MKSQPVVEIKKENDTVDALCMELMTPGLLHTRMALDPSISTRFLPALRGVMRHFVDMITTIDTSPEELEKLHEELAEKHTALNQLCREFLTHQIARLGALLIQERNRHYYDLPEQVGSEGICISTVQFNGKLGDLIAHLVDMAGGQIQFVEIQRECLKEVREAGVPSIQGYDRDTAEFLTSLCSAISKVIFTKTCNDPRRTSLALNGMVELLIAARDIATLPTVMADKSGEDIFMDRISIVIQETLEARVFSANSENIDQVINEIKKGTGAPTGATIH